MKRLGSVSRPLMWSMAVLLGAFAAGCGGGGDDEAAAPAPAPTPPIGDVAGVWTITETDVASPAVECAPPGNPLATYPVTVDQPGSGRNLSVLDASNPDTPTSFPGTITGDQIAWSGSFAERGGVTTWNSVNVTVAADCNTLSGTSTWTYVQDAPAVFSCTGTTTFTGAANVADGCAVPPASSS